ncbi:CHAT domain-containing protein [Mycena maculata]|uniref:CHAT domain-containing protein n=1 Tax=Mycena maculata TaxID=230809 RepID=A0AAD7KIQ6_9AGAR|nr:CHAT domain-containing protein [Mycena maculata]
MISTLPSFCFRRLHTACYLHMKNLRGNLRDVQVATVIAAATTVGVDRIQSLLSMHTDLLTIEDVPMDMMELASDILTHFNQAVDSMTLNNSIFLHREALAFPGRHPEHWKSLLELSEALLIEFRVAGDMKALQEAVSLLRELHLIQPNRWASLCMALMMEGTQTSNDLQMPEIWALCQKAIESDAETMALGISGTNLVQVFEQSGKPSDLDAGIAQLKEAQFRLSWGHPGCGSSLSDVASAVWTRSLNNLAVAVWTRFEQQGDAQDLDEAIHLHREALGLFPSRDPNRGRSLNNLASALQTRFEQRGDAQDFDEAIHIHREALALCPSPHPNHGSSLSNLASAVQTRFEQWGDAQDLDEAIQLDQQALTLCPSPHPNRGNCLISLASAVHTRFQQQGDAQDINEAIQLYREALTLRPSPHPNRGSSLNNLANAVQTRFQQQGDAQDIDEAIQLYQEALTLCPSPHPNRGSSLNNLAILLVCSYEHGRDPNHLNDAFALFQEASLYLSSSLLTRFQHTHHWASTAARYHHPSALPAYHVAINLLPRLAALHSGLRFRQQLLTALKSTDLVSEAAVCAVGLSQYATAVEFLEATRSVFWSQALHLRTPLNRLESSHPDLASRIAALARELEQASFRDTRRNLPTDRQHEAISIELEGTRYQHLNKDWEQAISSAQILAGFDDFMQPKGIIALKQAAVHGPIAILNAGKSSGHALLVKPFGEVQCVALPDISLSGVEFLLKLLRALLSTSSFDLVEFMMKNFHGHNTAPRGLVEARILARQEVLDNTSFNDVFQNILTDLWECMVRPVLDALNLKPESKFSPLPGTRTELKRIQDSVPEQWLTTLGDTTPATVATVLAHLRESSIVHFACHGTQDESNPLDSGLVLTDGQLKVSEIMHKLDGSQGIRKSMALAFLSACETAKGDDQVPDEAIHLAATLLFAGFRGVVATMW